MKRFSWRLTILAAALAACTGSASAQTTNCSGTLAPGTYLNVTVPANTTCILSSIGPVTVTNNVVVESGATLFMPPEGRPPPFFVNGSLLGRDAARIQLGANGLHDVVHILGTVNLTGTTEGVALTLISIGNTLLIANSTASFLDVNGNNVSGSVLIRDNTISSFILHVNGNNVSGSVLIRDNTTTGVGIDGNAIGGSLVCLGNTPAPTSSGNTVGGGKVGQCEAD